MRTSLGPRVARVHVGGGRTGFSTGAGPVTYYASGGGRSRPASGRTGSGTATAQRRLAASQRSADKQEQARELAAALDAIASIHEQDFPPAEAPVVPTPPPVDIPAIRARHVREAKAGTSFFDRSARSAALAEAERRTEAHAAKLAWELEDKRRTYQGEVDEWWHALLGNHPDTVLCALAEAFEDNEAAAAAVGLEDDEVTLVVVVPPLTAVPERKPGRTPTGNLSLKKLTKTERNAFYKLVVCGHVLVTVKEAFAAAPAVDGARVVAVRASDPDSYGRRHAEALMAVRLERARLQHVRWNATDAGRIVADASSELLLKERGSARDLVPLDLALEPAIAEVLAAIDVDEMT